MLQTDSVCLYTFKFLVQEFLWTEFIDKFIIFIKKDTQYLNLRYLINTN